MRPIRRKHLGFYFFKVFDVRGTLELFCLLLFSQKTIFVFLFQIHTECLTSNWPSGIWDLVSGNFALQTCNSMPVVTYSPKFIGISNQSKPKRVVTLLYTQKIGPLVYSYQHPYYNPFRLLRRSPVCHCKPHHLKLFHLQDTRNLLQQTVKKIYPELKSIVIVLCFWSVG